MYYESSINGKNLKSVEKMRHRDAQRWLIGFWLDFSFVYTQRWVIFLSVLRGVVCQTVQQWISNQKRHIANEMTFFAELIIDFVCLCVCLCVWKLLLVLTTTILWLDFADYLLFIFSLKRLQSVDEKLNVRHLTQATSRWANKYFSSVYCVSSSFIVCLKTSWTEKLNLREEKENYEDVSWMSRPWRESLKVYLILK